MQCITLTHEHSLSVCERTELGTCMTTNIRAAADSHSTADIVTMSTAVLFILIPHLAAQFYMSLLAGHRFPKLLFAHSMYGVGTSINV